MTMKINAPSMEGEEFSATVNGKTITIPADGVEDAPAETLSAYGGRINEYDDIAELDQPGILRQQHDGTAILDLRKVQNATTLTGTRSDGAPVSISVARMMSKHGWPDARYYMLERDADENIVVERGDNSRDIYVSADPAAWTSASIGAAQQPAIAASAVTGAWLLARPQYGGTAAQKVSIEVANKIKAERAKLTTAFSKSGPSDWYYLERGYLYTGLNFTVTGENPLQPIVVQAFGSGANPDGFTFGGNGAGQPGNIVFIGVNVRLTTARGFENVLVADCEGHGYFGSEASSRPSGLYVYRVRVLDQVLDAPLVIRGVQATDWIDENAHRWSGMYWALVLGSAIEACFLDHNGWAEGYSPLRLWNNGEFPQPPSVFSHNAYTQKYNADMSWIDMLSMRSASVAGQMRIGGWQMGCTSVDNPIAFQNSGVWPSDIEPDKADENGFFSFNLRSVATHGNNRPYGGQQGGKLNGFDWQGAQTTDVDCLAMHVSNPDDPADIAAKDKPGTAAGRYRGGLWSNLVVYRWNGDLNLAGLSEAVMLTITVQRRAAQLLDQPTATIQEYSQYVRSLSPRAMQLEIRALNRYLLNARAGNLELPLEPRTAPQTLILKPDWRAEGFRSDNPINWNSGDTPIDGDSLDLHGNPVKWVRETRALDHLTVGAGGLLDVTSGKVSFESAEAGAHVQASNCGKLHIDAFDGRATVRGGRFSVSAASAGSIEASGWGQVILGPSWTVRNGETLRICGDLGKVGWDAISTAGVLTIKPGGILEIHATPVIHHPALNPLNNIYALSTWDFWLNDFIGQTSGAMGKFDSVRRVGPDAYTRIRDLTGTPVVGELTTKGEYLRPANGYIGAIHPAVIGKIEGGWRGRPGAATGAVHTIVLEAGAIVKRTGGTPASGPKDITGAGITVTDQGAVMDPGFSVTGGKLVLTI